MGFEPTISAGERPKTYALDRAASGTGWPMLLEFAKGYLQVTAHGKASGVEAGAMNAMLYLGGGYICFIVLFE